MKVFFICDWDYTLFWPKVAEKMKATGFAEECSALVVGRLYHEELLKHNKVFENVYLLQDSCEQVKFDNDVQNKIDRIEKEYSDSTLWRYPLADRSWINCGYNEIRARIVQCFEYFEDLYSKEQPELIVTHGYSSMPHLISFVVAKKMGIKVFKPLNMRIQDRYVLVDNELERLEWLTQYVDGKVVASENAVSCASKFIDDFQNLKSRPDYYNRNKKSKNITAGHFYRFFRYIYRYYLGVYKREHSKVNPFIRLFREISWRVKRLKFRFVFKWDDPNFSEKYIYFPLHVQPEASTMLLAPYYLDQLSIAENLSRSLPINYRLVVKEHPSMIGMRDNSFYKRLSLLSNVHLVSPENNGLELVNNSSLVFTITGTAGFEGLLLNKPVIVLGSPYYRHCPLVYDASDVSPVNWQYVIKDVLDDFTPDRELLVRFVSGIFDRSFSGMYTEPLIAKDKVLDDVNVHKMCEQIIRKYMN